MPGGRLLGAETQRNIICRISGFKKWSQSLRNSASGRWREYLHVHFIRVRSKMVICKVVAYSRWSVREVVAMRVLTVFGIPINEQK